MNLDADQRARAAGFPSAGDQDKAYLLGFSIGALKKKHDWEARVYWQRAGQYALDPNLVDSDWFDSKVNLQGWVAGGRLQHHRLDLHCRALRLGQALRHQRSAPGVPETWRSTPWTTTSCSSSIWAGSSDPAEPSRRRVAGRQARGRRRRETGPGLAPSLRNPGKCTLESELFAQLGHGSAGDSQRHAPLRRLRRRGRRQPLHRSGRILLPARSLGLRQDDPAADGRRVRRARRRLRSGSTART